MLWNDWWRVLIGKERKDSSFSFLDYVDFIFDVIMKRIFFLFLDINPYVVLRTTFFARVVSKSRVILGPPNQWSKVEIHYNKTRPMYVPIKGLSCSRSRLVSDNVLAGQ
jgi:hypothetical protein